MKCAAIQLKRVRSVESPKHRLHFAAFEILFNAVRKRFAVYDKGMVDDVGCSVDVLIAMREADHKRRCYEALAKRFLKEKSAISLRSAAVRASSYVNEVRRSPNH